MTPSSPPAQQIDAPPPHSRVDRALALYRAHRSTLLTFAMLASERSLQMLIGLYVAGSIARNYSHDQFANWQIAFSLWIVIGTIGNVTGERVMLPRLCSVKPGDLATLWTTALASKLVSGFGTVALLLGWAATIAEPEVFQLALLWSVYLLIAEPVSLAIYESYAKDNFRFPQVVRIIAMLVRLAAVIVVLALDMSMLWIVAAWVAEIATMAVLLCSHWFKPGKFKFAHIDFGLMRTIFAQGAALAVASGASIALSRIDRVTLGTTVPGEVLAQYAAAMSLLEAAFGFSAMLASVVGAKTLFRPGLIRPDHHAGLVAFAVTIATCGALLIWLVAHPLVRLIFGEDYPETAHYLRYAVPLLPLVFAQAILQAPLLIRASNRYHLAKAVTAFAIGATAATIAASTEHYDLICVGAYLGYLTLIIFDIAALKQLSPQIYGEPGDVAS